MPQWIWQNTDWPKVFWNDQALAASLKETRLLQGRLAGIVHMMTQQDVSQYQSQVLCDDLVETSAIEGEILNRDSVRSSVMQRLQLDLPGIAPAKRLLDPYIEGLLSILLDATNETKKAMSQKRLLNWHNQLFQTQRKGVFSVSPGHWRKEPVFVVSGYAGREEIHFEGPPADSLKPVMTDFIQWLNKDSRSLDGIVRAAVAHFWFIVVHPFDDGNGRIARALSDWALAQDEQSTIHLYSLSAEIMRDRKGYYQALRASSKPDLDITPWILWFIQAVKAAILHALSVIDFIMAKARFWQRFAESDFSKRQVKVLNKMLDAGPDGFNGGLTTRKYVGMTKTSRATAQREIADLVATGCLKTLSARGRSSAYEINWKDLIS